MSVNIRYPNITAQSEKEQLTQIKSYLHQLVEQLNYALPTIGSGDGSTQSADTKSTSTYDVQGAEMSYYELRSLIILQLQEVKRLFGQLSQKIESEVDEIVHEALTQAKESGEFDGKDGQDGISITSSTINTVGELVITYSDGTTANLGKVVGADGKDGTNGSDGQDGHTPEKGVDYFTEEEVGSIATEAAGKISFTLDEDGNLYYEVEE